MAVVPAEDKPKKEQQDETNLPELSFGNVVKDIQNGVHSLIFDCNMNKVVIPALLLMELAFVKVIRIRIPCEWG